MFNPLIRKLMIAEDLGPEDLTLLEAMCASPYRIEAGRDIIEQGDRPNNVHLVLGGFAYRYKILPGGGRQIVAMLVPGDFCDLHVAILGEMDHAIATFTACTIVDIPPATVRELTEDYPRLTRALWWATLVDEGTLREGLANLGRREAAQRLAHLFCELRLRLQAVGRADETGFDMPLRQADLADFLGLTSVHVNRSLRVLRENDLLVLEQRRLMIPDVARLEAFCDFDPTYLHFARRRPA